MKQISEMPILIISGEAALLDGRDSLLAVLYIASKNYHIVISTSSNLNTPSKAILRLKLLYIFLMCSSSSTLALLVLSEVSAL